MKILPAIIFLGLLGSVHAELLAQDFIGSRIRLDARATEQVANDAMRATLFIEMEDADAGVGGVGVLAPRTTGAAEAPFELVEGDRARAGHSEQLRHGDDGSEGGC